MSEWQPSPNQQAGLDQQSYIEALLAIRSGKPEKTATKPGWLLFLESTGGAAMITVVLGTLGGTLITNLIQSSNQRQQAHQLSMSEFIKGEHETVKSAFDLVGECIAASENLNIITTTGFNPANFPDADQKKLVLSQKAAIRDEFNVADAKWRASRETLSLNIRYYNGNDANVASSWEQTATAVSIYSDCQHGWYMQHMGDYVDGALANTSCTKERTLLEAAIGKFENALASNNIYALKN